MFALWSRVFQSSILTLRALKLIDYLSAIAVAISEKVQLPARGEKFRCICKHSRRGCDLLLSTRA